MPGELSPVDRLVAESERLRKAMETTAAELRELVDRLDGARLLLAVDPERGEGEDGSRPAGS